MVSDRTKLALGAGAVGLGVSSGKLIEDTRTGSGDYTPIRVSIALDYLDLSQKIQTKFEENDIDSEDIESAIEWARSG